jgi:uncharacterized SAM-binding protein YcdF (DUF218 family)
MTIDGARYGWLVVTDQQSRRIPWGLIVGSLSVVMAVATLASLWFVWSAVQGIRNPPVDQLPESADAIVVFAGEAGRFTLGRELAEAGRAPVLVLNATALPEVAEGWCDEGLGDVDVVCLVPADDSTRGESAAFGALAAERGWASLIGVTADYHVQRAGLWLERCFSGQVAMAQLHWGTPTATLTAREFLALGHAAFVERSCSP